MYIYIYIYIERERDVCDHHIIFVSLKTVSQPASLAGMLVAGCSAGACESGDAKVRSSSAESAPERPALGQGSQVAAPRTR